MADADPTSPPAGGMVCPVAWCPVGMFLTASNQLRPEVVEHILTAGRELMMAVSALMSARAEAAGGSGGLEKIEVE